MSLILKNTSKTYDCMVASIGIIYLNIYTHLFFFYIGTIVHLFEIHVCIEEETHQKSNIDMVAFNHKLTVLAIREIENVNTKYVYNIPIIVLLSYSLHFDMRHKRNIGISDAFDGCSPFFCKF